MAETAFSKRFLKATQTEKKRLERRRASIVRRKEDLQKKVEGCDKEIEEVKEQIKRHDELLADSGYPASVDLPPSGTVLSGRRIREVAVRVLLDSPAGRGPIHYRTWLTLVEAAGYAVGGVRADSVFHNQITRSPLIKTTTHRGIYELDREAPDRFRREIKRLEEKASDADPSELREIASETSQLQRKLEEALTLLPRQQQ